MIYVDSQLLLEYDNCLIFICWRFNISNMFYYSWFADWLATKHLHVWPKRCHFVRKTVLYDLINSTDKLLEISWYTYVSVRVLIRFFLRPALYRSRVFSKKRRFTNNATRNHGSNIRVIFSLLSGNSHWSSSLDFYHSNKIFDRLLIAGHHSVKIDLILIGWDIFDHLFYCWWTLGR